MAMNTSYFAPTLNIDRVCRICLLEGANLTPIFCTEQEVDDFSGLSQKIQVCGSIEIHENDGLPSLICDVCIYKASIAHEFRQQCQQSDARLRLMYAKPTRSNITELQSANSHDYATAIEAYTESQAGVNETTVREGHPIDCQDEKLFLCNIGFEGTKEITEKVPTILTVEPHVVECPVEQEELTTTLVTVNAAGQLETQQLMVKNDAGKCNENVITDEYLREQLLNESVVSEAQEVDPEDFEEQQQEALLREAQQQQPQEEATRKKRASRQRKSKSYSEDDIANDDYFEALGTCESRSNDRPRYKCNVCLKRYMTLNGLKNHVQIHDKNHKCPICHKLFFKLKNMEIHRKIHETRPHACQLCHASFSKLPSLERHLKSHEDKNEDSKKLNEIVGETAEKDIEKTNKTETSNEMESEEEATGETNEIDEFENVPGLYKCEECSQFCSSLKNLKRHSLVHGEKKYSCAVCKKWFFRPDTLKKHAETHGHGVLDNLVDDNKLFESDDDTFASTTSGQASNCDVKKKYESDEDGQGEYKCQHCDKIMATKKGLRRHVSMHKPKAEPVTCEICKKVCASQARLALHLKTHNKPKEKVQREYLCHICSKVYPSNSSLTYHMRTHTGVKPHVCKICNSGFTTTTSLANHIRIHTGDKPFVCHVCSAAFAVSSAFRRHLTRHTGEANYLCKTCGKAFKRLSTLKEHTYTHSGEKPYVCKTCGAAYSHSGSLFAHQKRCRVQYGEVIEDHTVAHHIHVNNVQTAVRSLAVIGQMY